MGRNSSSPPGILDDNVVPGGGNDLGSHSMRGRFPFKRNPNPSQHRASTFSDPPVLRSRSHHSRSNRKGLLWLFPFKGKSALYLVIMFAVFLFATASMVLQSSITSVFRQGSERGRLLREGLKFGSTLRFVPGRISRRIMEGDGLDRIRNQARIGVRPPRLALVSVTKFGFCFVSFSLFFIMNVDWFQSFDVSLLFWELVNFIYGRVTALAGNDLVKHFWQWDRSRAGSLSLVIGVNIVVFANKKE